MYLGNSAQQSCSLIYFERLPMKILVAILVVLASLLGCKEATISGASSAIYQSEPAASSPRERTYEERRDEAVEKIKKQKDGLTDTKVKVDLTPLSGRKLGGLYTQYLGIQPGVLPRNVEVSFSERMATMYSKKVNYKRCKKKDPTDCVVASDTILSHAPGLLSGFIQSDKMHMDLKRFVAIADERAELAKRSLDWKALCKSRLYKLDEKKCKLLQAITKNISGKDIVAYGMTELLPSLDGNLNVTYTDILLKSAGAQFLYYIPSLGDRYASLGVYQFTFLALRDDDIRVEGTNVVNAYVGAKGEKVPGSVVALSGHQHHSAAFYFAIHNLATFISRLSAKEVETLSKLHGTHQDEMIILIACAHHAPEATFPAAERWLKLKGKPAPKTTKNKKAKKEKKVVDPRNTDIISVFTNKYDLREYAQKSRANRLAMYSRY